ncbi:aggregation-promoting factor C-terminal-like domain-containing protein [Phaeacidiphilus oryzae]
MNHLAHSSHAAAAAAPAATASTGVSTRAVSATTSAPSGSPQQIAAQLVPADQLASFEQIISHESGWNVHATNASSGAYGLGQALPGSKMASAGADWQNSAATQIKWALSYMNDRYGSPNAAWASWQANGWY